MSLPPFSGDNLTCPKFGSGRPPNEAWRRARAALEGDTDG